MVTPTETNIAFSFVEKHESNMNRPVIQETDSSPTCQPGQEI